MKHITDGLSVTNLKTSEKEQDSTRPEKVWVQLAEMFGNHFLRENGDEPPMLWKQAIWKLTDDQLRNGLGNLGNDDMTFPPNLSQFIGACKRPIPSKAPYWDVPKIEDKRKPGRMGYREWLIKAGKTHPLDG